MPDDTIPAPMKPISLALGESLETMAFVSITAWDPERPTTMPPDARLVRIGLSISDGRVGRIEVGTSIAFGTFLAANALALDPSDEECAARAEDTLRELLNVTCGTLIRRSRASHDTGIDSALHVTIGLPECAATDDASWRELTGDSATELLDAESSLLAVRLIL